MERHYCLVRLKFCVFRPKRWDEALEKPPLDYSDFFDDDTGQVAGDYFFLL